MKPLHLILGASNSRVLNLSDREQEILYQHSAKPFLKQLYNRKDFRFTLYYSGTLIEWLEKHHSEYVDVLMEMVKRRQVEVLGGAFYEPVLPFIPKTDRLGQIERMTTHIRQRFGRRPRGAWMPENMWDPRVAASLNAGGLEYLLLQDSAAQFIRDGEIPCPVLTEDQGKTITVLPVSTGLTDRLFVSSPEDVVGLLRSERERYSRDADVTVTLFFDALTIGTTENTSRERIAWFSEFLDLLASQDGWVETVLPGRAVQRYRSHEKRYAPVSTYGALMDWMHSLNGSPDAPRCNDCSFRSVLEHYPESSRLYARMHHTHVLVNQIRGDKYRKQNAREELWLGQNHFPYWPNRAGGLYNSALRKAAYAALIAAEKSTRERGVFIPAISRIDVDLDGREEILFQGNEINGYVHRRGAHLFELDYLQKNWNYLDTLQRRREPYHDEATRIAGYDTWPRAAFVDHLLQTGSTMDRFSRGEPEVVCDISGLEYAIDTLDKEHNTVTFLGTCSTTDQLLTLTIRKVYRFVKGRIDVEYSLINEGLAPLEAQFAVEMNLSLRSLEVGDTRMHIRQGRQRTEITPDRTELEGVSDIMYHDLYNQVALQISPSDRPTVWSFPVEAVGVLGEEPHWFYQSSCSVLSWPLELSPGERCSFSLTMKLDRLR